MYLTRGTLNNSTCLFEKMFVIVLYSAKSEWEKSEVVYMELVVLMT